jgi:hypothetical protein
MPNCPPPARSSARLSLALHSPRRHLKHSAARLQRDDVTSWQSGNVSSRSAPTSSFAASCSTFCHAGSTHSPLWPALRFSAQGQPRARELLAVAPPPDNDPPRRRQTSIHRVHALSGHMIIIETFARSIQPRAAPHQPHPTGRTPS